MTEGNCSPCVITQRLWGRVEQLEYLLAQVEWVEHDHETTCPFCENRKREGHSGYCPWVLVMKRGIAHAP